jgi:hypothetical protein
LSCGNNKYKPITLDIYFANKLNTDERATKYPAAFKDMCLPLKNICGLEDKKGQDYLFNKISLVRLDLSTSVDLKYLDEKKGDVSNINYAERQASHFLRDNDIDPILKTATNSNFNLISYLSTITNKSNIFLYSKNINLKIDSISISNSIDDLRTAISNFICGQNTNISKIIVIYDPTISQDTFANQPTPTQPTNIDVNAKSILLQVNKLSVLGATDREQNVKKIIDTYFADNFKISLSIGESNPSVAKTFENGAEYLNQLSTNAHLSDIVVTRADINNLKKITRIDLVEIQRTLK